MKKWMMLLMVLVLSTALAACGDDNEKAGDNNTGNGTDKTEGNSTDTDAGAESSDITLDNEMFQKNEKGFEMKDLGPDQEEQLLLDVVEDRRVEINGEDMLPLQMFEVEPDSEFLDDAHKNGEWVMEYEGERAPLPVKVVGDNYLFFLGEGHPDFDKVMEALDELN